MEIKKMLFVAAELISALFINLLFPENVLSSADIAHLRDNADPPCQPEWNVFHMVVNVKPNSDCNDAWFCKVFWIMKKTTMVLD